MGLGTKELVILEQTFTAREGAKVVNGEKVKNKFQGQPWE